MNMEGFDSSYQFGFCIAVAIHLLLAAVLLMDQSIAKPVVLEAKNSSELIQAIAVNTQDVNEAVNQIKAQETEKKQEKAHELKQAAEEKQRELKRLEQLRKEVQDATQKKQAIIDANDTAAKKLKALKTEETELAKLNAKKVIVEKNRLAASALAEQKIRKAALEKARQEQEKYIKDQEARETAEQHARMQAQMSGVVDKYAALIKQSIAKRWILPQDVNKQASCKLQIHLSPNGQVLSVSLVQSSGNLLLDRSVTAAVYKASPLPVPTDKETFARLQVINLTLRPEQVIS